MALFSECMPWCARKGLDTADIVRDAILRQASSASCRDRYNSSRASLSSFFNVAAMCKPLHR